jgi:hypothetical protein
MKRKRSQVLAWVLAGVAVAGGVIQLVQWATSLSGRPTLFDAVEALAWGLTVPVVFSVLAALIVSRQPRNRVGWLMMITALALSSPLESIVGLPHDPPQTVTIRLWLLWWLSGWSWIPVIFPIFLIPLYFPTGDLPSPRWKWVPSLAIVEWILFMVISFLITEGAPINAEWTAPNPIAGFIPEGYVSGPFLIFWGLGLLTVLGASVVSLFMRFRSAAGAERQQIRWLLFAGGFFLVFYAITFFASDQWIESGWQNLIFVLAILAIPVAIALAIFRYRLWDLDVVINRALVYGPLSTLMAVTFAAVIALTSEFTKAALGSRSKTLGAVISAVIVVVVFQPLRGRIQAFVDKRFYPRRLDLAYGLVEVEPEYWSFLDQKTLIRLATEHVCSVLGTEYAAFYLPSGADGFRLAGTSDGSPGDQVTLTLSESQKEELTKRRVIAAQGAGRQAGYVPVFVDRGKSNELLGLLSIGSRSNGKGYSGDDLKGLVELGHKIGLALNAVGMAERLRGTADPAPAGSG